MSKTSRTLGVWLGYVLLAALSIGPAQADQTDPRLDALFTELKQQTDLGLLARTESQIWQIWLEHPNADVERLMTLGTAAMNQGDLTQALRVFSEVINSYPNFAEGWNKRATLYYVAGDYDASLEDIRATLALEPRHFGALSGLGLVQIARKDLRAAQQAFEDLVSIHPYSPNALSNLEMVLKQIQRNTI